MFSNYFLIVTKWCNSKSKKVEYRKMIIKTKSREFPFSDYAKRFGSIYPIISCIRVDAKSFTDKVDGIYYAEL